MVVELFRVENYMLSMNQEILEKVNWCHKADSYHKGVNVDRGRCTVHLDYRLDLPERDSKNHKGPVTVVTAHEPHLDP